MKVAIRRLAEEDLDEADRIFRLAFGTFLGMPDPTAFMGDSDLVRTRWRADPSAALGAFADGELVGSNFATQWGSFGSFGPLTVRPELWNQGVARALLEPTIELFERWGTRQAGLFTFANSPKHAALYQRFGFWPQYLTAVTSKAIAHTASAQSIAKLSELPESDRTECLSECRALTDALYPGLDLEREIRAVVEQAIGDTVLVRDGGELAALAICHVGAGSEAGSGSAYVKFGAARPGAHAARHFDRLLSGCETFARAAGAQQLVAGVNAARHDAYRTLLERGFRTVLQGVAMQRPNEPGWNRGDCYVIDDWR